MQNDSARQTGTFSGIEITPEMIEAGVEVLRREFGGQTEGANRFVDFAEVAEQLLRSAISGRATSRVF